MHDLSTQVERLVEQGEVTNTLLSGMDSKIGVTNDRLSSIDNRLAGIDSGLGGIDHRMSGMDDRLGRIQENSRRKPRLGRDVPATGAAHRSNAPIALQLIENPLGEIVEWMPRWSTEQVRLAGDLSGLERILRIA